MKGKIEKQEIELYPKSIAVASWNNRVHRLAWLLSHLGFKGFGKYVSAEELCCCVFCGRKVDGDNEDNYVKWEQRDGSDFEGYVCENCREERERLSDEAEAWRE